MSKTITEINRNTARVLRAEIDKKFAEIAAEFGVNLTLGNITMSRDGLTFSSKVEAVVATAGVASARELEAQQNFQQLAALYDMNPNALGASFIHSGKRYTVKGLKMGRTKVTLLVSNDAGQEYGYNVSDERQRKAMGALKWEGLPAGESFVLSKQAA